VLALRRGVQSFGSFALSMRSRTHGGPPSFANFARCSAVIRIATVCVALPGSIAGRPGRFFAGVFLDAMPYCGCLLLEVQLSFVVVNYAI
jgi:hypothetical protein